MNGGSVCRRRARPRPGALADARGRRRAGGRDGSRGLRALPRPGARAAGLVRHASDNRVELDRARHAFDLAAAGRTVAVVSGATRVSSPWRRRCSRPWRRGTADWAAIPLRIVPGLSAMQAAAARLGAPLGHDFCVHVAVRQPETLEYRRAPASRGGRGRLRPRDLQPGVPGAARPPRRCFAVLRALKSACDPGGLRPRDRASRTRRWSSPRSPKPIRRWPT